MRSTPTKDLQAQIPDPEETEVILVPESAKPATPKHTGGSKCKRCGFEHHTTPDGSCPALKTTCGFCNRIGHYESAMASQNAQNRREESRGRQKPDSPNRRRGPTPGPARRRPSVNAHTVKADSQCIHFDSITTQSR